jgi:Uma2 family endonuclease
MGAMPVTDTITVEEYLSTDYSPDCGYVDGILEDRELGEKDHSELQNALIIWFYLNPKGLGLRTFPGQRVQVSPTRFRVPDLSVIIGEPGDQVFTTPPLLCIEILSRQDQFGWVLAKVSDYLTFGVPYVWVIDPRERKGTVYSAAGSYTPEDRILRAGNPDIALPLADLF